jgi:hypothetical protein
LGEGEGRSEGECCGLHLGWVGFGLLLSGRIDTVLGSERSLTSRRR